jgi:hypothetical protein
VQKHFVAAKLAGDDPPTTTENLKLFFSLYADAYSETPQRPKRVVCVSNWLVATNDDDRPAQCFGGWPPGGRLALFLPQLKYVSNIGAPVAVITDKFCAVPITVDPNPSLAAIW